MNNLLILNDYFKFKLESILLGNHQLNLIVLFKKYGYRVNIYIYINE